MLIALGTTMIFYSIDSSEIKTAVSSKLLIGIEIGGTLASIAFSVGVGYLISYLQKKFKKVKVEEKSEN